MKLPACDLLTVKSASPVTFVLAVSELLVVSESNESDPTVAVLDRVVTPVKLILTTRLNVTDAILKKFAMLQ